jgi:hypothetical protein
MANNQINLHAVNSDGNALSVQHTSTDAPLLPAANLAQLKEIDPRLIDLVIEQTGLEAAARRKTTDKINSYVFWEKISGVLMGGIVAIFGFGVGGYCVLQGHDWAGAGICGISLATIVGIFVTRKVPKSEPAPEQPKVGRVRAKKAQPSKIR